MSYEPTNWKSGDVVTSAKLNKLEQGVAAAGGGGVLVVEISANTNTMDKTWQEINDAANAGLPITFRQTTPAGVYYYYLSSVEEGYSVYLFAPGPQTEWEFYAGSASGYPASTG